MKPHFLFPPLIALGMLAVIWAQTSDALKRSGTWTPRRTTVAATTDPYARLDGALAEPDSGASSATLRDPFTFPRVVAPPRRTAVSGPTTPRAAPRPEVTAIVTGGGEPHAIVRFEGTSYSVKPGELFARFRVVSITADQVVVEDGREQLVLRRPSKGE